MITATWHTFRYLAPVSSPVFQLSRDQLLVLLPCPMTLDNLRIEDNVPSLVALLLSPTTNMLSDTPPVPCAMHLHCFPQSVVFLCGPVSLHKHWITELLPPVLTLVISACLHLLSYFLPVSHSKLFYSSSQLLILLFIPESSSRSRFPLCGILHESSEGSCHCVLELHSHIVLSATLMRNAAKV